MGKITLILVVSVSVLLTAMLTSAMSQDRSTYDDVVAGMKCFQNTVGNFECEYSVGKSLKFDIVAPGKEGSIYIYKSDYDRDYFAIVGISHGCVIVNPGRGARAEKQKRDDLAYVSPRNGKVYRTWQECGEAK